MRGKHTRNQKACFEAELKEEPANRITNGQGNHKCEESEYQTFVFVFGKTFQIKFESSQKHNVQKANRRKEVDRRIFGNQIQSVRTNDYTGKYQSDDAGNFHTPEQQGRQKNYK